VTAAEETTGTSGDSNRREARTDGNPLTGGTRMLTALGTPATAGPPTTPATHKRWKLQYHTGRQQQYRDGGNSRDSSHSRDSRDVSRSKNNSSSSRATRTSQDDDNSGRPGSTNSKNNIGHNSK